MTEATDVIARFLTATEKLLMEAERLRRDVVKLNNRVVPFDTELPFPEPEPIVRQDKWRVVDALNVLEAASRAIKDSEYDLAAIRAKLDEIKDNEASREEVRPYIK